MADSLYDNDQLDGTKTAVSGSRRRLDSLTLSDGLYGLVLLAAAVLRLSALGKPPLSPAEASAALPAWQVLQPGPTTGVIGSPAYFSLTSIAMSFLGVSDATARLVPALFGLALVTLPWLLRRQLKPAGALVAGLLLAVSPLLSAISRTAGGDAIALFALLLLVTAVIRWEAEQDPRWVTTGAMAVAGGLTSSTLFYSGIVAVLPAWWVARRVMADQAQPVRPPAAALRKASIVGALVFFLLSTRFLTYPAGLAASAQLLGDWLGQFSLHGELGPLLSPALAIGRYETAVFLFGIPIVFWAIWRNQPLGTFFTYWILIAFALMLLQRGILSNTLLAVLPAYLLIGLFAGQLNQQAITPWTWAVTASLVLVSGVVVVNLARYLRVAQYGSDASNLWFAFLAIACGAIALYYFWSMTDADVWQGAFLAGLIVLALYQWGTAWYLTHAAANDPRERWVQQGTDDDLPVMLETLEEISNRATNADADLGLFSAIDSPVLRWYLRDYWRAEFGATIPTGSQFQAIITPADAAEPALGIDYFGSDFGWLRTIAPESFSSASPVTDGLRNWLFHESSLNLIDERLILWLRSDIAQGP